MTFNLPTYVRITETLGLFSCSSWFHLPTYVLTLYLLRFKKPQIFKGIWIWHKKLGILQVARVWWICYCNWCLILLQVPICQIFIASQKTNVYIHISMTSFLTHTVAHSTKSSFRPNTNYQPLKKSLSLSVSWVKVVKKILTLKVNFLC